MIEFYLILISLARTFEKENPLPGAKLGQGIIYTVIQFSEPARGRRPLHDGRNGREVSARLRLIK